MDQNNVCHEMLFKTLEKIKRKAFRKSLEKEKAILAQVSPAGLAHARPRTSPPLQAVPG
jgi:hypothetical protein